jgi:hypothetical protein
MSYRSEETVKSIRQSSKQAIALAMEGRWLGVAEPDFTLVGGDGMALLSGEPAKDDISDIEAEEEQEV